MSKAGLASAVLACLPEWAMEKILHIWEIRGDWKVIMHFKGGRCVKVDATEFKQFGKDDFGKGGAGG